MPPRKSPSRSRTKASKFRSLPLAKQQEVMNFLGRCYQELRAGNIDSALPKLEQVRDQYPDCMDVHSLLGGAYMNMRRFDDSLAAYKKALAFVPKQPDINYQYGLALESAGDFQHAHDRFDRVLQHRKNDFNALCHKCSSLCKLNRYEDALGVYNDIKASFKHDELTSGQADLLALTAVLLAPDHLDAQQCIDALKERIELENASNETKRAGYAQIGRLYKHLKMSDEEFHAFASCKAVDNAQWDPDQYSQSINTLIDCWTNNCAAPTSSNTGFDGSRLIFIVGMTRSGTSLTEQMLAQLKGVEPGGEMNAIDSTIPKSERDERFPLPLPLQSHLYDLRGIDKMAKDAAAWYNAIHKRNSITDKQPFNYVYVPLIARMFPGAKFIHTKREPLDCCLSNLMTSYSQLHPHTHDQYWLGRYYADYERVMDAWSTLPEVNMIDLQYEQLVAQPESEMRRVIEFLGIQWSDDVLDFHSSVRKVKTASREQVNKPLYNTSVNRYHRYEHLLGELQRGLREGRSR